MKEPLMTDNDTMALMATIIYAMRVHITGDSLSPQQRQAIMHDSVKEAFTLWNLTAASYK